VSIRPEATFRPGDLRIFQADDGAYYWYLIYDVVNMTGQDITWAPSMVLYTDRGEVHRDGRDVSRSVQRAVQQHVGDPLLESKASVIGQLRQGPAHARRGVAVWPAGLAQSNELRIFVEGISPESVVVTHPTSGAPVTLRKNLALHYLVPGDARVMGDQPVSIHPDYASEEHWVFR